MNKLCVLYIFKKTYILIFVYILYIYEKKIFYVCIITFTYTKSLPQMHSLIFFFLFYFTFFFYIIYVFFYLNVTIYVYLSTHHRPLHSCMYLK